MTISINRLKTTIPVWLASLVLMSMFLYGTSPDRVGPQGVTIFFLAAYLFVGMTIHLTVLFLRRILARPGQLKSWKVSYAMTLAFLPVTAVGLQSLGQLVLRDILIFVALVVLVFFYISKSSSKSKK